METPFVLSDDIHPEATCRRCGQPANEHLQVQAAGFRGYGMMPSLVLICTSSLFLPGVAGPIGPPDLDDE